MDHYIARILYEKMQQGCWLSLLDENLEEISDRLPFHEWCIDGGSISNNASINFKLPKLNAKAVAIGFYVNEFDCKRYLEILLDSPVNLDCDYTCAMFRIGDLKFIIW